MLARTCLAFHSSKLIMTLFRKWVLAVISSSLTLSCRLLQPLLQQKHTHQQEHTWLVT